MNIELVTLTLFGALLIGLVLGLPLAFTMGGIGVMAALWLWGPDGIGLTIYKVYEWMREPTLLAVPFFIFMACLLERSGIADALYEMMHRWLGFLRGGLAVGTLIICVLFAAMTGITGAATVTMGIIALPAMLSRNYDKGIALGSIASGGTLGILIPPSVMMVILGIVMRVSVGKLFMAGVIPGIFLAFIIAIYVSVRCYLQPQLAPKGEVAFSLRQKIISLRAVVLPLLLVFAVLGSIFAGIATPTEAAAVGALGALICVFIHRRFGWQLLKESTTRTLSLSVMVVWVIFGATSFLGVYTGIGGSQLVTEVISGLEANRWLILIGMMVVVFIMGMFLDPGGIIMLAAPIFAPIVANLGFDLVWFGILFIVNLQMGYITPPFGYNLFYLKSVSPLSISMGDIYRAIIPFVVIMIIGMAILMAFPSIALWLPNMMRK